MSDSIKIPDGYKQTDVGIIPEDWGVSTIAKHTSITTGAKNTQDKVIDGQYPFFVRSNEVERINSYSFDGEAVLTAGDGVGTGKVFHYINGKFDFHQRVYKISDFSDSLEGLYFYLYFQTHFHDRIASMTAKSSVDSVRMDMISEMLIPLPSKSEQKAIAKALSDADCLINNLEKVITKKRDIKFATMQQLLTGQKRLPGFVGKWEIKTLFEIANCLDQFRIPLNEDQRNKMKGDIPYCGANGIVDYVDDFVVNDDIILIAEDGGYFEEFATRPIAYRMTGKCWVNNHAHILKSKKGVDQGFLFYSLVHKDIQKFLASGTRAKLNKNEMFKIEVYMPNEEKEQKAVSVILTDIDADIEALQKKITKTKALKKGMMQELLTGRIRFAKSAEKSTKKHNWAIDEAVIISTLVSKFGSDNFPLGRKRYTKMSYLFHRYIDGKAEGYLKKAAGPYNPKTKYGGVETLARKNGYIQNHKNGKFSGFITGDKIEQALGYFKQWYGEEAMQWLEQFRYEKNDILELWATVDMAVQDLKADGKEATVESVKNLINKHKEWKAKLKRDIFSDDNISEAITKTRELLTEA